MTLLKHILIMASLSIALSGCNGCWSPMPVVSCGPINSKSDFERYSRPNTDDKQKNDDMISCGAIPGKNGKVGNIFETIRQANPGGNNGWLAVRRFDNCIMKKDYQYAE